jgi:hypothetical protein
MYKYSCVVMVVALLGFGSLSASANDFDGFISDGEDQGFTVYWNWKMLNGELVTFGAWIDEDGYVYQEGLFGPAGGGMGSYPISQEFGDWADSHGFSLTGGGWGSASPCATFVICGDQHWMQL